MTIKSIPYRLCAVIVLSLAAIYGLFRADKAGAVDYQPDQEVLFSDDFSGTLDQWSDPIGNWLIDQGELVGSGLGGGTDGWIYAGDPAWTDYLFQAKLIFVSGNANLVIRSTGHWQNEYRIDLWQQDAGNSNRFQVIKYQDGVMYELTGGLLPSPVPIVNPSVVQILASGNQIFIYINGESLYVIDDPTPLTQGRIGLGVIWDYINRFDDVLVTTLPPIMMYSADQNKYAEAGSAVDYTIVLENHTGLTDSFSLAVQPGTIWPTIPISDVVGPIAEGESITFTVRVEVPVDALPGEYDSAIVEAISVNSPELYTGTIAIKTGAASDELAYVTQSSNELAVIDRVAQQVINNIDIQRMGCSVPFRPRITPAGDALYILCSGTNNLIVLTLPDLTLSYAINDLAMGDSDIVFSRDGRYAFIGNPNSSLINVLDISAQSIVANITLDGMVTSMEMSTNGYLLYAAGRWANGGRLFVIDARTWQVLSSLDFGSDAWDVAVAPDDHWIYVSDRWGAGIAVIDVQSLKIVDVIPNTGELTGLALAADGKTIFAGTAFFGRVDAFDIETHGRLAAIEAGDVIRDLTMDCEGRELYVPAANTVVAINPYNFNTDFVIFTPSDSEGVAICPQVLADIAVNKSVDNLIAQPGKLVNYTLTAQNIITSTVDGVAISDTLPISLTYQQGSLHASSGQANYLDGTIIWNGDIITGSAVTITFAAKVSPSAKIGTSIINLAAFREQGKSLVRSAVINIQKYNLYLPCTLRSCPPVFSDDFSNPASGWPIESGDGYALGYKNNEYSITIQAGYLAWALRDFGVRDYRLVVDARAPYSLDGAVAVMFSANDYGFYLLQVSDGWYALDRVDAYYWQWTTLIDWTPSAAIHPGNAVNHLEIVRVGAGISLYANNQLLASLSDSTYGGTWHGMAAGAFDSTFEGRFDNFALYTGNCIGGGSGNTDAEIIQSPGELLISPAGSQAWSVRTPGR